ncbi:MAG TPA: hydantoinase B/oxoprolinase family protein [Solirubrobacteraceae bacterium]|jgi:N-methylhydantoinase B/acetone carboxylase alpha subunit|nr:hydantoinase B/oxoprolinase family protein [Solirubrobacteraceae bacterium]
MATTQDTRGLQEPDAPPPIGWDGRTLAEMLAHSEQLFAETGYYHGLKQLALKDSDPLHFEKLFSRVRGGMVSARETALNISASPIVRELGEICFALYTPEGDNVALSTGIIVHVHTMSEAIKYMVRHHWEDNPHIRPGDVFANNQPTIGDVHNADVQTFVPIFWEDELIAWAGGVIHVMDIGASTPGGVCVAPTTRFDDGIDLHCMKIGEKDTIASWHWKRVSMQSRAPGLWILDERTRLAGCHMIRDTVERLVLEEGVDTFKQFMREAIEDGRRSFKHRARTLLVPGRYRSVGFLEARYADKTEMPKRARRDQIMHGHYEAVVDKDGHWTTDLRGASAWGWHSFNATPAAQQGMQWILFTQTLICNDKINDGAYYATDLELTPGTWANLGEAPCSSSFPWMPMFATSTGYLRAVSRALQSRGYIEEIVSTFTVPGNVAQGGGIDQYGQVSGFMNFEIGAQGQGGKYVLDGLDYGSAVFNPEGDMGDIEMWELVKPMIYLGRRIKPYTGGVGRHRGGSSFESLLLVHGTPDFEIENIGAGGMFTSPGLFGGYPGAQAYVHNVYGSDIYEQAAAGAAYPVADVSGEDPQLNSLAGEHEIKLDPFTLMQAVKTGDVYLSSGRGGGGLGDPLLRSDERIEEDIAGGHIQRAWAEKAYARADREAARRRRLERARPTSEWWAEQRERILHRDLIDPVKVMYAESMRLGPRWAAEFRGFWDLPEDFDFDVITPTVGVQSSEPGKVTPAQTVEEFLGQSTAYLPEEVQEVPVASQMTKELLADLLDEKLSRRAVHDIQSGHKDPDRFDKWVALLQERVSYDDRIVLPFGEGLNIVRRASDGELVIRSDAGHDFCRWDENWKMHAVMFVRDTDELYRELYPAFSHPEGDWMELREYYCPISGQLLETEAVTPGYPVVHEYLPDIDGFYRGWLGREVPA